MIFGTAQIDITTSKKNYIKTSYTSDIDANYHNHIMTKISIMATITTTTSLRNTAIVFC